VRVVLLNQYYAPDDAATAQLLADVGAGLSRAGHRVCAVCSSRAYRDTAIRYPARERIDGVEVRRGFSTSFGRSSSLGRLIDYLTFLISAGVILGFRSRPDVVVSLSTPPMVAALGLLMARLRRARAVYWVMDVYPDVAFELGALRPRSLAGRLFAALSRSILRRSDLVVALGETMADRLREAGARRISVVHNWADGEAIRPQALERHPLRADWGWSERFVVLYSGNMGLAHEFATVLDAVEQLRDDPRILFAFVGAGPRRDVVEAEVRRRGLDNVEFRPYMPREELGQSLTSGDIHLVTLRSRMPGLLVPSKIYGILAAGRATLYVGPDRGEIADIVREGECGTLVAQDDVPGLVAAVRGYAADAARTAAEGRRARELFDRRFTRDHGLAAFAELVEDEGRRR